jgi:hypothetical protein
MIAIGHLEAISWLNSSLPSSCDVRRCRPRLGKPLRDQNLVSTMAALLSRRKRSNGHQLDHRESCGAATSRACGEVAALIVLHRWCRRPSRPLEWPERHWPTNGASVASSAALDQPSSRRRRCERALAPAGAPRSAPRVSGRLQSRSRLLHLAARSAGSSYPPVLLPTPACHARTGRAPLGHHFPDVAAFRRGRQSLQHPAQHAARRA